MVADSLAELSESAGSLPPLEDLRTEALKGASAGGQTRERCTLPAHVLLPACEIGLLFYQPISPFILLPTSTCPLVTAFATFAKLPSGGEQNGPEAASKRERFEGLLGCAARREKKERALKTTILFKKMHKRSVAEKQD